MSLFSRGFNRTLAVGATAAAAALVLAGCSTGSSESDAAGDCTPVVADVQTVTEGSLTVGTYDYPPLSIVDGDSMSGVEGDLLKEVADRLCLDLVIDSAGGAGASIPSVETNRVDLAAGDWYRTKARAEIVRLSEPIYLDESGVWSKTGLTVDELPGKKVASVVGNLWNASMTAWLGSDFSVYQDDETIFADLAAGRVDAVISSVASTSNRMETNPIEGVDVEVLTPRDEVPEFAKAGQVGWPTNYDNESIGDALDVIILEMHKDGTIKKTLEKWGLNGSAADVGEPYEL